MKMAKKKIGMKKFNFNSADTLPKNEVQVIGKFVKFNDDIKASTAFKYLENIKLNKESIWYFIIEKQEGDSLQMIKYNSTKDLIVNKFINDLKSYYMDCYSHDPKICESISKIEIIGSDAFSTIHNLSDIQVEGKKLITKITEDLIKLLS